MVMFITEHTDCNNAHAAAIAVLQQRTDITNITDIIDSLVALYRELYAADAYEINCGSCYDFACDLIDIYGSGDALWHDDMLDCTEQEAAYWSHCFTRINNKYYDSECPEGVDNWRELPCFRREAALVTRIDTFSNKT